MEHKMNLWHGVALDHYPVVEDFGFKNTNYWQEHRVSHSHILKGGILQICVKCKFQNVWYTHFVYCTFSNLN